MEQVKRQQARLLESNPKSEEFLAFYDLASEATDALRATLTEVIPIPQAGRENISVHQWAIFLGTLAEENAQAASELLLLDMLRAASVLVRQLYEQRIKLNYLFNHPDRAIALFDSLQFKVTTEARNAGDYFSREFRDAYEKNYKQWAESNPKLESSTSEETFKRMVEDVVGEGFETEYFRFYSAPSIVAHGKPHGIVDVLSAEEGGRVKKHFWQSRTVDSRALFSNIIAFTLILSKMIRLRIGLDSVSVDALDAAHRDLWRRYSNDAGSE